MLKNKKIKTILKILTIYLIYIILISTLYYNKILSSYMVSSINLIFMFLITYLILKKLKFKNLPHIFCFTILFLIIMNILFIRTFTLKTLVYYIIILTSFVLANKTKEKKEKLWTDFSFIFVVNWYKNYISLFRTIWAKK